MTRTRSRSKSKELTVPDLENFEFSQIDKFKLDEEWIQQERLIGQFAKLFAQARRNVDEAKSALELKEAKLDKRIRQNPVKYALERATEGAITKETVMQLEKAPEPQLLIQAKYELAICQAAIDRLMARGKAISDLIFLFSIEYFAHPRIPRGMKKEDYDKVKERPIIGVHKTKRRTR